MSNTQPKKIIITALENELDKSLVPNDWLIFYSKIGKINATITTFAAIKNYNPQIIVNFGTAGAINSKKTGLIEVSSVVERDFCAMPFAKRGIVPFANQQSEFFSCDYQKIEPCICGTGDNFVSDHDPWLIENKIDIVDMELFAIAKTAQHFNIKWRSFKFISDNANSESAKTWQENVSDGGNLFIKALKKEFSQNF